MQTYKARFCALVAVTFAVAACGDETKGTVDASTPDASVPDAISLDVEEHPGVTGQQAYLKTSDTSDGDRLGEAVALSASGDTLAVGAVGEDSSATGVDGDQDDNSGHTCGAVYVFHWAD